MSETWTTLLAALVGAIVGGAASLAGTMVANKRQMAANARMRLYDELLPKLADAMDAVIYPQVPEDQAAEEAMPELLERVRRACAIAGPQERKAAHRLWDLWTEHHRYAPRSVMRMELPKSHSADFPPLRPPPPRPLWQMKEEIGALSDYLGAKLG